MIKQISVFLENRVGQLSAITGLLAQSGIDLRALNIAETSDYGILRVIPNDPAKALSILKESGFIASCTDVASAAVPDEPGGLHRLLDILARNSIDIEYMYSIFTMRENTASMVFRVADPGTLEKLLGGAGIEVTDPASIGIVG